MNVYLNICLFIDIKSRYTFKLYKNHGWITVLINQRVGLWYTPGPDRKGLFSITFLNTVSLNLVTTGPRT